VEIHNLTFERTVETDAFDEHVYLQNCRRVVIEGSRFVGPISRAHHAQKGVHLRGCRYARIVNNVFEDIADNALALNWLDAAATDGHHGVSGNVFVRRASGPAAQIVVTQSDVTVVANAFHGQATTGLGMRGGEEQRDAPAAQRHRRSGRARPGPRAGPASEVNRLG
jgi:hypothetical protein